MNTDQPLPPRHASTTVQASYLSGVLVESYTYRPGPVEPLPAHAHAAFQFGFSHNCTGEYVYRGALHRVPPGSISIIQSGEAHSPSGRRALAVPATFQMVYLDPHVLAEAAAELHQPAAHALSFAAPSTADPLLVAAFLRVHASAFGPSSQLALDEQLLALLARLLTAHTRGRAQPRRWPADHRALVRVREYLTEQAGSNVSLRELGHLAGLSRYHLCRAFRRAFGVSPHTYHVQVRIDRAKALLASRMPIADVARATGFADQSHFGRHFKRLVGISPGRYAQERNNVPDR